MVSPSAETEVMLPAPRVTDWEAMKSAFGKVTEPMVWPAGSPKKMVPNGACRSPS